MNKTTSYQFRGWLLLSSITIGLLAASWIIIELDLDRRISALFYDETTGWFLGDKQPWDWLYHYGTIPGLILGIGSLLAWFWSFSSTKLKQLHRYFLVIVLTAILGPGVMVNGILKNYWSRPRPRQVEEFGGQWIYRHPHQPGIPGKGESFPCGHCTMGFLFCSLMIFRKKNYWLAYGGAATGLILGSFLSIARIVQGAHFLLDTLWSMGILLMLPIALYLLIIKFPGNTVHASQPMTRTRKLFLWMAFALCLIVMTGGFLLHRPFYKDHHIPFKLPINATQMRIEFDKEIEHGTVKFVADAMPHIIVNARGFAWIGAKHRVHRNQRYNESIGRLTLELQSREKGYFSELSHELQVRLPVKFKKDIKIELAGETIWKGSTK